MFSRKDLLKKLVILITVIPSNSNVLPIADKESKIQNPTQISWIQQMGILRKFLKECENSSAANASSTWQCLKIITLNIVDSITRRKIILLWPGVRFVQISNTKENQMSLKINQNDFWQHIDLQYLSWFDRLASTFIKMLKTHILEINLKELTKTYLDNNRRKDSLLSNNTDKVGTARHRRHRFNMMITMMFGVTALGAVLIPMGFQMLSIVSGKALLLAKMALLLASINGLKRVANTGLHYGLYHVPGEHYDHYYDRGDLHHPRNVPNLTPVGASVDSH